MNNYVKPELKVLPLLLNEDISAFTQFDDFGSMSGVSNSISSYLYSSGESVL